MPRFVTVILLAALGAAVSAGELVDGIAAQVGSEVVLVSEVERIARPVEAEMRNAGAPEGEIAKMRAEALERLIERRLIEQVAQRAEVEASETEVEEAIAAIAEENHLTLEILRRSVEGQGLPFEAYQEKIRGEIVYQKVLGGMVRPNVRIEDHEVEQLYREYFADQPRSGEEVHVRQILVTFAGDGPASRTAACTPVRAARERILAGEPFDRVAAEVSETNPGRGGDLGWLYLGEIARWMSVVLEQLEPGKVSDVIETSFGCSLLLLVERREVDPVSFEEAELRLKAELFDRKFEEEYLRFTEQLRQQTYIERKGLFADAARLTYGDPNQAAEPPQRP